MEQENVLERVYNLGRLRMAWRQVRKNAGAAGMEPDFPGRFHQETS